MPVSADRPLAVLLNNDFADWEAGFLTASVRDFFDTDVLYFSPDGKKVKSEGGLTVKPDGAFDDVTPEKHRAIVVCGSGAWQRKEAPDITPLLNAAIDQNVLVGAICAGTLLVLSPYALVRPCSPSERNPDFCSTSNTRPDGPTTAKSTSPKSWWPSCTRVQ